MKKWTIDEKGIVQYVKSKNRHTANQSELKFPSGWGIGKDDTPQVDLAKRHKLDARKRQDKIELDRKHKKTTTETNQVLKSLVVDGFNGNLYNFCQWADAAFNCYKVTRDSMFKSADPGTRELNEAIGFVSEVIDAYIPIYDWLYGNDYNKSVQLRKGWEDLLTGGMGNDWRNNIPIENISDVRGGATPEERLRNNLSPAKLANLQMQPTSPMEAFMQQLESLPLPNSGYGAAGANAQDEQIAIENARADRLQNRANTSNQLFGNTDRVNTANDDTFADRWLSPFHTNPNTFQAPAASKFKQFLNTLNTGNQGGIVPQYQPRHAQKTGNKIFDKMKDAAKTGLGNLFANGANMYQDLKTNLGFGNQTQKSLTDISFINAFVGVLAPSGSRYAKSTINIRQAFRKAVEGSAFRELPEEELMMMEQGMGGPEGDGSEMTPDQLEQLMRALESSEGGEDESLVTEQLMSLLMMLAESLQGGGEAETNPELGMPQLSGGY